jgi:hypothetical protein
MSLLNLSVCRMQSRRDAPVLKGMDERDTGRLFNARLRGGRVSFSEAGLNPRGVILLPRNNLYSSCANTRGQAGQRMNSAARATAGLPKPQALIVAV